MGTTAGHTTSGPATPVSAGGAAVPAGTTGNATNGASTPSGKVASIVPVKGAAADDPRFAEKENPEADEYIAKGRQAKKDRIAKAKSDAHAGSEAVAPTSGKKAGGKK